MADPILNPASSLKLPPNPLDNSPLTSPLNSSVLPRLQGKSIFNNIPSKTSFATHQQTATPPVSKTTTLNSTFTPPSTSRLSLEELETSTFSTSQPSAPKDPSFQRLLFPADAYASFLTVLLILLPFIFITWQLLRLPRSNRKWIKKNQTRIFLPQMKHISPYIDISDTEDDISEKSKEIDELTKQEEVYFRGKNFLQDLHKK